MKSTSVQAFQSLHSLNGASIVETHDGLIEIRSSATPWAYALVADLRLAAVDEAAIGVRVSLDVEVEAGTVGLFLVDGVGGGPLSTELMVDEQRHRTTVKLDASTTAARQLCIRTGARGPALVRILNVRTWIRRTFDITHIVDGIMPVLLKHPGPVALDVVASELSKSLKRPVEPNEIGALECRRRSVPIHLDAMWDDPLSRLVWDETLRLVALLPTYDPDKMDPRNGYLGRDFFATYLKQSAIRVYHLLRQFHELHVSGGAVLEVGSLFGQFAVPLRRLGCDVTIVDRYKAYDDAFAGYTEYLRSVGVHVIETDRTDEAEVIGRLGQFDVAISMAVIEHIPHTPREFLRMLASHVRIGGLLAVDTPNIVRYWNRKRLAEGRSIHQDIVNQFYADTPYEGHHREFTADEAAWMLEQVGCADVKTVLFDFNLLQFPKLSEEHLTALLSMTIDPSLADTILAVGRVGEQPLLEAR